MRLDRLNINSCAIAPALIAMLATLRQDQSDENVLVFADMLDELSPPETAYAEYLRACVWLKQSENDRTVSQIEITARRLQVRRYPFTAHVFKHHKVRCGQNGLPNVVEVTSSRASLLSVLHHCNWVPIKTLVLPQYSLASIADLHRIARHRNFVPVTAIDMSLVGVRQNSYDISWGPGSNIASLAALGANKTTVRLPVFSPGPGTSGYLRCLNTATRVAMILSEIMKLNATNGYRALKQFSANVCSCAAAEGAEVLANFAKSHNLIWLNAPEMP